MEDPREPQKLVPTDFVLCTLCTHAAWTWPTLLSAITKSIHIRQFREMPRKTCYIFVVNIDFPAIQYFFVEKIYLQAIMLFLSRLHATANLDLNRFF